MPDAFGIPQLEDLGDLAGARVLVRCDFNVPLRDGEIVDDLRIRSAVPTLVWLQEQGASVVACSHLGRPKGAPDPAFAMDPVRARLDELVPGVELLENVRFDPGETKNDPAFVAKLTEGIDAFVLDAFGAAHRSHASVVGPAATLPSAAGRLLAREVEVLLGVRTDPRRPFVGVLGGAKVSDKLGVIDALLDVCDSLVVGGGMCFTFLKALGHEVGDSLLEDDQVERCRALLDEHGDVIHLPSDIVAERDDEVRNVGRSVPEGWRGLDIGPGSAAEFGDVVLAAGTVLWNGPMGMFEDPRFAAGTEAVARAMAETKAFTVIGGGDSAAAVAQFGLDDDMDHVSTGGGASLELIEQGDLPGLAALRSAPNMTGEQS
ncbi:MAG: phosphoglycerate kinase [Actinomycetota bacterium]